MVAGATPRPVWGWSNHPMPKGVVRPPPKGQKKKKKKKEEEEKEENWVLAFGGGRTTPKGLGVASATPYGRYGVASTTPGPWGWSDPLGHGGGLNTPRPAVGVVPLAKNGVAGPIPFWPRGWLPNFILFFFPFNFHLFFLIK